MDEMMSETAFNARLNVLWERFFCTAESRRCGCAGSTA